MTETFNPDVVTLSEKKDGTLLDNHELVVLEGLNEGSAVARLGNYIEMGGERQKDFTFLSDVGAYWVGEGEKVKTSKGEVIEATLVSKKLSTNIITSREVLDFTWTDFFEQYKERIIDSFNKEIDRAVIQGINNPFGNSIESAVEKSGKVVEGDLNIENILDAIDLVYDAEVDPTGVVSSRRNRKYLRKEVDGGLNPVFDRLTNTIDGLPVVDVASLDEGDMYVGDFDKLYFGIPKGIEFNILTESTISDVNAGGEPINLGERQLVALQPTLHFAALVIKEDAFAKVQKIGE